MFRLPVSALHCCTVFRRGVFRPCSGRVCGLAMVLIQARNFGRQTIWLGWNGVHPGVAGIHPQHNYPHECWSGHIFLARFYLTRTLLVKIIWCGQQYLISTFDLLEGSRIQTNHQSHVRNSTVVPTTANFAIWWPLVVLFCLITSRNSIWGKLSFHPTQLYSR